MEEWVTWRDVYHVGCEFDNVEVVNCVLSFSTADDKWRCNFCVLNGMVYVNLRELYTQKEEESLRGLLTQCCHTELYSVWERESMMVFLARCCYSVLLVVLRLTLLRRRWHNWHKTLLSLQKTQFRFSTEKGRRMVVYLWPLHARCPLVWSLWVVDMQRDAFCWTYIEDDIEDDIDERKKAGTRLTFTCVWLLGIGGQRMSYVSLCVTDSQLGGIKNTAMSLISSYLPRVIEKRGKRERDGSQRHKLSTG